MPTTTGTDEQFTKASEFGKRCGENSASWAPLAAMSQEQLEKIIQGVEDCDPEILEMEPAPLSGEYADGLTVGDVLREAGVELPLVHGTGYDYTDLIETFDEAFSESFWDMMVKRAKHYLKEMTS